MRRFRRADIAALVEEDRVHRDVYVSAELFALEQRHFFANTWTYLGHASQVPEPGDYITVEIAGRPLLMVRQADGGIRVLYNRCAPIMRGPTSSTAVFSRCQPRLATMARGSRIARPAVASRP